MTSRRDPVLRGTFATGWSASSVRARSHWRYKRHDGKFMLATVGESSKSGIAPSSIILIQLRMGIQPSRQISLTVLRDVSTPALYVPLRAARMPDGNLGRGDRIRGAVFPIGKARISRLFQATNGTISQSQSRAREGPHLCKGSRVPIHPASIPKIREGNLASRHNRRCSQANSTSSTRSTIRAFPSTNLENLPILCNCIVSDWAELKLTPMSSSNLSSEALSPDSKASKIEFELPSTVESLGICVSSTGASPRFLATRLDSPG